MLKAKKGFTLIELLIVIIILAILIAIVVGVAFQSNRNKAIDIDKKSDVASLQKKLEEYFVDNSSYPGPDEAAMTAALVAADGSLYMTEMPVNPSADTYEYSATADGGAACTTAGDDCTTYALEVELSNTRDNGANTHPTADCPLTSATRCYIVESSQ